MTTVWQRWTRLRNVAQEQEKILEDAVQEWKGFNDKVNSSLGKSSLVHTFSLFILSDIIILINNLEVEKTDSRSPQVRKTQLGKIQV